MKKILIRLGWVAGTLGLLCFDLLPSYVSQVTSGLYADMRISESINVLVLILVVAVFILLGCQLKLYSFKKISGKHFWLTLITSYAIVRALTAIGTVLTTYLSKGQLANQDALTSWLENIPVFTLLYVAIGAPIMEEIVFRGMIFKYWFPNHPYWALGVSSVLFFLAHGSFTPGGFVIYGGMGLVFGWVYHYSGRLEYSTALHMLNNTIAAVTMLLVALIQG